MKTRSQKMSRSQERRVAQQVGGREQFGSGSMAFAKGDVRVTGELRIECKVTESDSFVLKKEVLDKIVREAQQSLEQPVLQIDFYGRSLSLAITLSRPSSFVEPNWPVLATKSVRLAWAEHRDMLYGQSKYLAFLEKSGDKRWYRIELWQSFLDRHHRGE